MVALMWDAVFTRVTGVENNGIPATLNQYQRYCVKGAIYPGLVAENESQVQDTLYTEIADDIWQLLDDFEGLEYECIPVQVNIEQQVLEAWTYCFKEEYQNRLNNKIWCPEEWQDKSSDSLFL